MLARRGFGCPTVGSVDAAGASPLSCISPIKLSRIAKPSAINDTLGSSSFWGDGLALETVDDDESLAPRFERRVCGGYLARCLRSVMFRWRSSAEVERDTRPWASSSPSSLPLFESPASSPPWSFSSLDLDLSLLSESAAPGATEARLAYECSTGRVCCGGREETAACVASRASSSASASEVLGEAGGG
jgi:hypothetical protein